MTNKFKVGDWVTVVLDSDAGQDEDYEEYKKYYAQFIGKSYPITYIERDSCFLPVPLSKSSDEETPWDVKEIRLATKEEVEIAKKYVMADSL